MSNSRRLALCLEPSSRRFKPCHPDQYNQSLGSVPRILFKRLGPRKCVACHGIEFACFALGLAAFLHLPPHLHMCVEQSVYLLAPRSHNPIMGGEFALANKRISTVIAEKQSGLDAVPRYAYHNMEQRTISRRGPPIRAVNERQPQTVHIHGTIRVQ